MKTSPTLLLLCGAMALLMPLPGCVTPAPPSPAALCAVQDSGGQPIPAQFTGTTQKTVRTRAANHVVQLNTIATAGCAEFDRVVFDFDGLRLPPKYTVEYVNGAVSECGSGEDVPLAGTAKLKIRFQTSQAHTEDGHPTVIDRNRTLNLPNLKQLVVTCDFEGEVEIVLGLQTKRPYRAVELVNDSKLVIDVKH
jgi:hypothetical protein